MPGLYHASLYAADQAVPSYWEASVAGARPSFPSLAASESCDVAIIGGGYTGLSAALHLARDHQVDVRVLEAGPIGWGASGRNGGFCCLAASKLSLQQMIRCFGLAETQRFYAAQIEGMELTAALLTDEGIAADRCGDGNFEVAHRPEALQDLESYGAALEKYFGIETRLLSREAFLDIGHESQEQFGALHINAGFALHPLKFTLGLAQAAARHGAKLHARSPVESWSKNGKAQHVLKTPNGELRANKIILATNGFTPEALHPAFAARIMPVLSNIVVTRPLTPDELAAQSWRTENPICNTRDLLFYYRMLPDKSFLLGARGDMTGKPADGARMQHWMARRLGEVFPGWRHVAVRYFWRGLVCMSMKFAPSLGRLEEDPSVWYGYGYHANGVNTAPWAGRALARMIAGVQTQKDIPAVLAGPPPQIPFAALRRWYLRAYCLKYRITDDWF